MSDQEFGVRFVNEAKARSSTNKIIKAINAADFEHDLEEIVTKESLVIDALFLFDSSYSEEIESAYRARKKDFRSTSEVVKAKTPKTPATRNATKGKPMANNDFKKFVFKDIELQWPRLDQTHRYNSVDKKTEPCAPTAGQAAWSVGIKLPYVDAKRINEEMKAHYEDCRTRNSKLPEFSKVFSLKRLTDEDGNPTNFAQFTAKKNAMSKAGEANKEPLVVGTDHQPLADKAIWSGSKGHVRVLAYPVTDPDGVGGISLLLDTVVVTDPIYGGANLEDDFGAPSDFDDLPPSQDFQPAPAPEPQRESAAADGGF